MHRLRSSRSRPSWLAGWLAGGHKCAIKVLLSFLSSSAIRADTSQPYMQMHWHRRRPKPIVKRSHHVVTLWRLTITMCLLQ